MDIISHGLWGGIAVGRKSKKSYWLSLFFGVAPDLFSFGIFFMSTFLGFAERPHFGSEPPDLSLIPAYVGHLYNITHSLVIFALGFFVLWLIFRKPVWESLAWGLHVLLDIPTHTYKFFPTPFLWPISSFKLDGHSWGTPEIFIPDVTLLAVLYIWFFVISRRDKHNAQTFHNSP